MKIHNCLPTLIECLKRWKTCPTEKEFNSEYVEALRTTIGDFFEDFHEVLLRLNWSQYRENTLKLNPLTEENRFRHNLSLVESLFQFKLEGEAFLIGTFHDMDGFARFDRGLHKVYLGVDENFNNGRYIDVLTTHELTHVARESRPEVWEGFGLDPKMKRNDFLEYQPVIEHLMGEGFSCAISEILVPNERPWTYVYQTEKSLRQVYEQGSKLDQVIHREIKNPNGDYGHLYGIRPTFAHYVWAWEWVKKVLREHMDQDPKKLVNRCSKDFISNALEFKVEAP